MIRRLLAAAACAAACVLPGRLAAQQGQQQTPTAGGSIDSIEVSGNHRVTTETVLNTFAVPIHTNITYRDIQRGIRALVALGQFDDVQVSHRTTETGTSIMSVALKERPLVVRMSIHGADKISERSVREKTDIPSGRPLDPASLARARTRIDSMYEAAGYYLADVKTNVIPLDTGRVAVVIEVTENRRVAISQVEITGNHAFTDEQIVGKMKTRPEGFWWFQSGEYADTRVREDLDKHIPEFYGGQGYIDFRILRDTLLVDQHNGKAKLQIDVDEGTPYRVGSVSVDGNRFFTTEQVMSLSPFHGRGGSGLTCLLRHCSDSSASFYDQLAWDAATQKLRIQYANEGYIYADVQAQVQRHPPADSGGTGTVDLSWVINERRPAIINRVEIVGNETTHEKVIREAIVILPGDVFRQDMIIRSYQNISNLGFFQQPLPFPDQRQSDPNDPNSDIDLVFHVQEKHTGNVNFGASVGQGAGVGGFLGLEEPNLFGEGKHGKLQWQFGAYISDFSLSYSDPSLWGSRVSGTAEVHDSRIRYTVENLGEITSKGTSYQVGLPLPHSRYSRIFVNAGLDWENYSGNAATINSAFACVECFRTSIGASLMRDTRIDLPFPTGGSMHSIGVTFNGPFKTGSATFTRYDLEGHWYTPVARIGGGPTVGGIKLVLGLSSKAGFVTGEAGPFFRQLFAMGGTQYGIPLRGYDEFSITPQGFNPLASTSGVSRGSFGNSYFAMTGEFGVRLTAQIYVNTFFDAGNVWVNAASFNPTRLYRGVGFGVALITPLGPLGLDLGYGLDRTDQLGNPAPAWKLHFKVGNFF